MQIQDNILLAPYTTFRIGGLARHFVFAQTEEEIIAAVQHAESQGLELLMIGGGSNILVSNKGFDGLVVRTENIGIDMETEVDDSVILKLASGEIWDDVVRFAVEQSWYGIENLSHIPGFVGAFAVQNVGAYGQEASQVVVKVDAYDRQTKDLVILTNEECSFGYRSSIFNSTSKNRYVILNTYIKLAKHGKPNLSYGDLKKYFSESEPNIASVREAVINIRNLKFPFPDAPEKGNAGSFFQGPVLDDAQFQKLLCAIEHAFGKETAEKLQSMTDRLKVPQGFKTPTAFLIELCGLKGYKVGGAMVNIPQPAIVLNFTGSASSDDVLNLFRHVSGEVFGKTGVKLRIEPELIGFNPTELSGIV